MPIDQQTGLLGPTIAVNEAPTPACLRWGIQDGAGTTSQQAAGQA
jgi:hypothetical protein